MKARESFPQYGWIIMKWLLPLLLLTASIAVAPAREDPPVSAVVLDSLDVAPVWAGHPVGFTLLTHAPFQFVAFYDDKRQLTIARRKLDERKWQFTRLPDTTGWDSHNYITMTVDDGGFLHLSGDMHAVPLKYFRSTKPLDPATFERVEKMTGVSESRVTYPKFLRGPENELIFTYRDGGSGNGNQIFNVYEIDEREWKRLLDQPLTDGEGKRNAYFDGPVKGPDGWFHLAWVWRESPDAATNHDLSYARSKDLRHWENAAGTALKLPIRLQDGVIVDPVPQHGGIINGNTRVGFDDKNRVTISYHKYDSAGNLQPWTARLEDADWKLHQTADWPVRWNFGGGGSINFGVSVGRVTRMPDGRLTQDYHHMKFGSGTWLLDPGSLKAVGELPHQPRSPGLGKLEGSFPGLSVKTATDFGTSDIPGVHYILRWETLDANRDQPRTEPLPGPSMLRVCTVKTSEE